MGFSAVSRLAVCFTALQVAIVYGQLTVTPTRNESVFLGGTFDRVCEHSGATTLEWLHNGTVIRTANGIIHHLSLGGVDFSDAGQYSCRAQLSGGGTEGPRDAGHLTVVDPDIIVIQAPPLQYALDGKSVTLRCTTDFPNSFITWLHGENINTAKQHSGVIGNVTLEDEGTYLCRVYLSDLRLTRVERVQLRVIIPPVILSHPPPYTNLMGTPTTFNLTVQFRSRFRENTTITWQRNNSLLPDEQVQTNYTSENEGVTIVNFPTVSRSDAGLYQVTIKNALEVIPTTSMTTAGVYQLHVIVPPAVPSNVRVSNTTSSQVQVTWSLTHQHADERAESLTLTVLFSNGTIAQQYQLEGNVTQQMVETLPGMEYRVTVSVFNQDGTNTTDPVSFQTSPGRPSISSVEATRLNTTTYNLSVSLAYTGGGAITHFRVSFRDTGTTPWSLLQDIPAIPSPHSNLSWSAVVSSNEFATYSQVEFMLNVTNQHGFVSNSKQTEVELVLPGAPTLSLLSSTSSSLTIKVQLSPEGTPPFLQVVLQITGPKVQTLNNTPFDANDWVQFEVTGLSADTAYTVMAYTVNHAGSGPSSDEVTYRTGAIPQSLPMWAVITIAVGGSVAMVIGVILTVAIFCYCRNKYQQNGDKFYAGPQMTADEKKLDPNHEMVKRQPNSLQDLHFGNGPFTPRSPCYTMASSLPRSSPIPGSARYDYNSTINGSEGSEIGYPHYTLPAEALPLSLPNTRGSSLSRDILSPFSPPPLTPSCSTDV